MFAKTILDSIIKLVDVNGTEVFKASYDAWGKRTVTNSTFKFLRGYTGHEHLDEFSLINMNGRMYDPLLGRFLSPDPFVQFPDFSQNFNRYSYCLNNPLLYTDPSGEIFGIDDVLLIGIGVAVISGATNWYANGAQFNAQGLAFFGTGAAGGALSYFFPPVAVGIAIGTGTVNSLLSQGFTNGWNHISFQQTLFDAAISGASVTVGSAFANSLSGPIGKAIGNIKSPLVKNFVANEIVGVPTGALFGGATAMADEDPNTSFWDGAWQGAKTSFVTSGMSAVGGAAKEAKDDKVNFFTGKGQGNYSVYQGTDTNTGEVKYVGITGREPEVRWDEHQNSGTGRAGLRYRTVKNGIGLTKTQAQIMEQTLINKYGMQKNGGLLLNKSNSMSPKYWNKYGIKK